MKTFITIICSLLIASACFSQPIPQDSLYLAKPRPGNTPVLFQLPINGTSRPIERVWTSNDGKEFYYSQLNGYPPTIAKVFCYKYLENRWQGPFEIADGYFAPSLSPNDSVLFVQLPVNYTTARAYYMRRTASGWTAPSKLFSFTPQSHYTQLTSLGNYYTSTNFQTGMYRDIGRIVISGNDTTPVSLGPPVNSNIEESDFYIARNESFLLFIRHTETAASDFYISYKKSNGGWTNPKALGPNINLPSPSWEYGPYITSDNKYLFFTRGGNAWTSYNTYWVKIDNVIDSLMHTNFVPYVKYPIGNKTDSVGRPFNYTIPDTTFIDDDGNNTLTYTAKLANGNPLPGWLTFNPSTRNFSGTPSATETDTIRVKATDNAGDSAVCTFILSVLNNTGIIRTGSTVPDNYNLGQNYPNPFNPVTCIDFAVPVSGFVTLRIYDMLGREIGTLINEKLSPGTYKAVFNAEMLSSGIYIYTMRSGAFNSTRKMILIK